MSLEITRGTITNHVAINGLIDGLTALDIEGSFYAGYPIIASADSNYTLDAILISPKYGLIAFICPDADSNLHELCEEQDHLYYILEGSLSKHEVLRKGRRLAIRPNVITYMPSGIPEPTSSDYIFADQNTLHEALSKCAIVEEEYYKPLCAAIQRVTSIKPPKRREKVTSDSSRGGILKRIEKEIANLDQWQKKAAIEIPEGAQRIRGLAGSGKTIVLALKAAYLHTQYPDWDILVTYHTRSLSQQIRDLIERFTFEHSGDKPNWEKLHIMHSWGSAGEPGTYSRVADSLGLVPVNFGLAKQRYGNKRAFEGICEELLASLKDKPSLQYDAVLIDEAQDLPVPFFRMVYAITKQPKRIFWAYDELQNLNNNLMPTVDELFGVNDQGIPNISVKNNENEPARDIVLPVCYRNTPWALTLAHALAFGVYRSEGLVQLFENLDLWKEIGYTVESGSLDFDKTVTLSRSSNSYPAYFNELMTPDDAVITKIFDDTQSQYEWVASEILKNIKNDELDQDDILVIFPNAISAKNNFMDFSWYLRKNDLNVHLAGISTDRDTFTINDSITSSNIFRAKGNEAPMVYILNAEWCAGGLELIRRRNTLFTSITRSRAWVRICGVGEEMVPLKNEIDTIYSNNFKLSFRIPTPEELKQIRLINRDMTVDEIYTAKALQKKIDQMKKKITSGKLSPDKIAEMYKLLDELSE